MPRLLSVLTTATLLAAGCARPPHRNPPPAFQAPVDVTVSAPAEDTAGRQAAQVAAERLNRSRAPDERPVRVVLVDGPLRVTAASLGITPPAAPRAPDRLVDPRVAPELNGAELDRVLGIYDAVLVVGLTAREGHDAAWLRAQPGWRLALGTTHFRDGVEAPSGLVLETAP